MTKVEKSTNEAMEWMNSKLNLQNKQSLTVDPVVKTKEIEAKIKVFFNFVYFFWQLFCNSWDFVMYLSY